MEGPLALFLLFFEMCLQKKRRGALKAGHQLGRVIREEKLGDACTFLHDHSIEASFERIGDFVFLLD